MVIIFLNPKNANGCGDGASSSPRKVTSDVPQGTVLGPLLFFPYINDFPPKLQCTVHLFADHCLLYAIFVHPTSEAHLLQNDLYKLEEWQITLKNVPQCVSPWTKILPPMNFTFFGQVLENLTSHPYLGVQFDRKWCWKEHIEFLDKGDNKILGIIRRNFWFCNGNWPCIKRLDSTM